MEANILTIERQWVCSNNQLTILKDSFGRVKRIITNPLQQPKKSQKEITIRKTVYLIDWESLKDK